MQPKLGVGGAGGGGWGGGGGGAGGGGGCRRLLPLVRVKID